MWDLEKDDELRRLKGHTSTIIYLKMSNVRQSRTFGERDFIVRYSIDTEIRIWGLSKNKRRREKRNS